MILPAQALVYTSALTKNTTQKAVFSLAGPLGFEPRTSVLETDVLPLKLQAYFLFLHFK